MNSWFLSDVKAYTEITVGDWTERMKETCLIVYYEYVYPIKENVMGYISPITEDMTHFLRGFD